MKSRISKPIETQIDEWLPEASDRGEWAVTTNVYRISFRGAENVLELRVMMNVHVFKYIKNY